MKRILVCALALLFAASAAMASEKVSVEQFLVDLDKVRADLEQENPRALSSREWLYYNAAENEVRKLLSGIESIDELSQQARGELFTAQERMASVLVGDEDERLVCRREPRTGTRIRKATCVTMGQLKAERAASQASLDAIRQWKLPPAEGLRMAF